MRVRAEEGAHAAVKEVCRSAEVSGGKRETRSSNAHDVDGFARSLSLAIAPRCTLYILPSSVVSVLLSVERSLVDDSPSSGAR